MRGSRARRIAYFGVIGLAFGLLLLGVTSVATPNHQNGSTGLPFDFVTPVTSCSAPNPLNGCGASYDIPILAADYAFWVALTIAASVAIDAIWRRRPRAVQGQ